MKNAESWLKATLDYEFSDPGLFRQALTHRSADGESNERLEFLGDAVLDTVVSEYVFRAQPFADEGDLSRLRASIVRDRSLAALAADLGIGDFLYLGVGERKSGGHRRESILADAVEALIGAIYLDGGYEAARQVIESTFAERLRSLPDPADLRDPKTRLQEWLQARGRPLPEYLLVEIRGQSHRQTFEVECRVTGSNRRAHGTGPSRRNAEQHSAREMLVLLQESEDE